MKLLDRYLLAQYVRHFLTINIAFVSLYLLIDLVERIDNFTGPGRATWLMPQYFLCKVPLIIDQLNPFLIMVSGILTIGILIHNNEIVALKAAGIPLMRILRPIILPACVFTLIFIISAQFILPITTSITNSIWYEKRKLKISSGIQKKGKFYFKGESGFYSFTGRNKTGNKFTNFSYSKLNDKHELDQLISAEKAVWKNNKWILFTGQIQEKVTNQYATIPFEKKTFIFPETPENFVTKSKIDAPNLTDLYLDAKKSKTPYDQIKTWTRFFEKISYLLLGIPIMLMSLSILTIIHRKWNCDLTVSIPCSCCVAFVAWGMWGALQALAKAGVLPPLLAASGIHLLFGMIGLILLLRENG